MQESYSLLTESGLAWSPTSLSTHLVPLEEAAALNSILHPLYSAGTLVPLSPWHAL